MSDLRKLRQQQAAMAMKVALQIEKDSEALNKTLAELADKSGKTFEELVAIIDTAHNICEETDQSIYELLKVKQPESVTKANKARDDDSKALSEWRSKNDGRAFTNPAGKTYVVGKFGRLPNWVVEAVNAGTITEKA